MLYEYTSGSEAGSWGHLQYPEFQTLRFPKPILQHLHFPCLCFPWNNIKGWKCLWKFSSRCIVKCCRWLRFTTRLYLHLILLLIVHLSLRCRWTKAQINQGFYKNVHLDKRPPTGNKHCPLKRSAPEFWSITAAVGVYQVRLTKGVHYWTIDARECDIWLMSPVIDHHQKPQSKTDLF